MLCVFDSLKRRKNALRIAEARGSFVSLRSSERASEWQKQSEHTHARTTHTGAVQGIRRSDLSPRAEEHGKILRLRRRRRRRRRRLWLWLRHVLAVVLCC